MPIVSRPPTPQEAEWYRQNGYDPTDIQIHDNQVEPTPTSALGAGLRSFAAGALPAAGGGALAGALSGAAEGAGLGPVGMLIGGIGGGLIGGGAVGYIQQQLMPQTFKDQLAKDQKEHPYATIAGQIADIPLGGFVPSTDILKGGMYGAETIASKLGGLEGRAVGSGKQSLVNALTAAGLGGAQEAVMEKVRGEDFDPTAIGRETLIGSIFNKPWALGHAYGFHEAPINPVETPEGILAREPAPIPKANGQAVAPSRDQAADLQAQKVIADLKAKQAAAKQAAAVAPPPQGDLSIQQKADALSGQANLPFEEVKPAVQPAAEPAVQPVAEEVKPVEEVKPAATTADLIPPAGNVAKRLELQDKAADLLRASKVAEALGETDVAKSKLDEAKALIKESAKYQAEIKEEAPEQIVGRNVPAPSTPAVIEMNSLINMMKGITPYITPEQLSNWFRKMKEHGITGKEAPIQMPNGGMARGQYLSKEVTVSPVEKPVTSPLTGNIVRPTADTPPHEIGHDMYQSLPDKLKGIVDKSLQPLVDNHNAQVDAWNAANPDKPQLQHIDVQEYYASELGAKTVLRSAAGENQGLKNRFKDMIANLNVSLGTPEIGDLWRSQASDLMNGKTLSFEVKAAGTTAEQEKVPAVEPAVEPAAKPGLETAKEFAKAADEKAAKLAEAQKRKFQGEGAGVEPLPKSNLDLGEMYKGTAEEKKKSFNEQGQQLRAESGRIFNKLADPSLKEPGKSTVQHLADIQAAKDVIIGNENDITDVQMTLNKFYKGDEAAMFKDMANMYDLKNRTGQSADEFKASLDAQKQLVLPAEGQARNQPEEARKSKRTPEEHAAQQAERRRREREELAAVRGETVPRVQGRTMFAGSEVLPEGSKNKTADIPVYPYSNEEPLGKGERTVKRDITDEQQKDIDVNINKALNGTTRWIRANGGKMFRSFTANDKAEIRQSVNQWIHQYGVHPTEGMEGSIRRATGEAVRAKMQERKAEMGSSKDKDLGNGVTLGDIMDTSQRAVVSVERTAKDAIANFEQQKKDNPSLGTYVDKIISELRKMKPTEKLTTESIAKIGEKVSADAAEERRLSTPKVEAPKVEAPKPTGETEVQRLQKMYEDAVEEYGDDSPQADAINEKLEAALKKAPKFQDEEPETYKGPMTPGLIEFNKGNKAVGKDGRPLILKHGSGSDIIEIDLTKSNIHSLFGPGFYTTTSRDVSGGGRGNRGYSYKSYPEDPIDAMWIESGDFAEARKKYYDQAIQGSIKMVGETDPSEIAKIAKRVAETLDDYHFKLSEHYQSPGHGGELEVYDVPKGIHPNVMPLMMKMERPFEMDESVFSHIPEFKDFNEAFNNRYDETMHDEFKKLILGNIHDKLFDKAVNDIPALFKAAAEACGTNEPIREWHRLVHKFFDRTLSLDAITWRQIYLNTLAQHVDKGKLNYEMYKLGYDGIHHTGGLSVGNGIPHDVYIGFYPTKIKSAIGNNGNYDLTKYNITYQPEISYQANLIRPELDVARERAGEIGKPVADAAQEFHPYKNRMFGKYTEPVMAISRKMSDTDKQKVSNTLTREDIDQANYRNQLTSDKQRALYDATRSMLKQQIDDQTKAGQMVSGLTPEGKAYQRLPRSNPSYFPSMMKASLLDTLVNRKAGWQDIVKKMQEHWTDNGITPAEQTVRLAQLKSIGDSRIPNDTRFKGNRLVEGIGLPMELRETNFDRLINRYNNKKVTDRAFYDLFESKPEVMNLLDRQNPDNVRNEFGGIIDAIKGQAFSKDDAVTTGLNRFATTAMLGPLTNVHVVASTGFNPFQYLKATELVSAYTSALSNLSKARSDSLKNGIARHDVTSIKDITDGSTSMAQKLQAASSLVGKLGGREWTDVASKTFSQAISSEIVPRRLADARRGDKYSVNLMKQLDSAWTPDKQYSPEEMSQLASNMAEVIHGAHDFRNLPSWMNKDSALKPFFALMSWTTSQSNAWNKHVWQPAKSGNIEPLLMSALGAGIGGYVIKEIREAMANKKDAIPMLSEIQASSRGVEGNMPLLAYKFAQMATYTGFGGLAAVAAKDLMDLAYKNKPQGSTFPLDEAIANISTTVAHATSAWIQTGDTASFFDIFPRMMGDLIKDNTQTGRIALNWAAPAGLLGEEKQQLFEESKQLTNLRKFKMTEGLPYAEQGGIETNPYLNIPAKQFKRTQNLQEAAGEIPRLMEIAKQRSGGDYETYKQQLEGFKSNSYQTMPSPENQPMQFSRYYNYLVATKGKQQADEIMRSYMQHNIVNKVKSSLIP